MGASLVAAVPALAAHDRSGAERWDRGYRQERVVIARERPVPAVVDRTFYGKRAAYTARPVYAETPSYYPPKYVPAPVVYPAAPAYAIHREPNILGAGVGAAMGAVIGSQVGSGYSRAATAAVGAVIGSVIGSQF
jgi:uncharacterized protein YcfJ